MNKPVTPKMQTREGAAAYTGLSVRQLQRRELSGELRRLKPGGLSSGTYYLTEDLDALIDAAIEAGKAKGARPKNARAAR